MIDLREQYIIANLIIFGIVADQIMNMFIEARYEDLGLETTFLVWWSKFYFEYICIRLIPNIYIYVMGLRRLPEFAGYKPRTYPGQMFPRGYTISPRRSPEQQFPLSSIYLQNRISKPTDVEENLPNIDT